MELPKAFRFDVAVSTAMVIVFPLIIIGAQIISTDGLPLGALAVMAGAFATALFWGTLNITEVTQQVRMLAKAGLELVYTMPFLAAPSTLKVVESRGVCPHGFGIGDSWEIDDGGRPSAPLCRAAVEELATATQGQAEAGDVETSITCRCPLVDPSLTFAVRSAGAASAN